MHTFEIIKKAFNLPFKAYKGFILVTILFFISEITNEIIYQIEFGDLSVLILTLVPIGDIVLFGASIAIVYHYIDESFDIRKLSLKTTTKVGFNELILELYYYNITLIGTTILSYLLGIFHNINSIIDNILLLNDEINSMTLPRILEYMNPEAYQQLASSVIPLIAIFLILFTIFFSYCSLGKIILKETNSMKESVNLVKLTKIIKRKGFRKYLNFVILTLIVLSFVLLLMKTFEYYFIIGSVFSALAEAFALFFVLDSFSLFYYSN